ncbi:hypothetical protein Q3G72_003438 [Acer saccharum]|nr:hypothetical protein Q3G72_003438 [Acer saccharum]
MIWHSIALITLSLLKLIQLEDMADTMKSLAKELQRQFTEHLMSLNGFKKYAVKRKAVDIWGCKDCGKVTTGGAYTLNTASAVTVRSTIRSLSEETES